MNSDPSALLPLAAFATAGLALIAQASLKAWEAWLEVRRLEISRGARRDFPTVGELKARVRRLEAIADGLEA